jgi:hypothetical protein
MIAAVWLPIAASNNMSGIEIRIDATNATNTAVDTY